MEKKNSNNNFNKLIENKKKVQKCKFKWANLSQINGGLISPSNGKNIRVISHIKERPQSNENLKIKLLDNTYSQSECNSSGNLKNQENNISSKGRLNYFIKKNEKNNRNNNICSNSVIIQSKTAKKLIDNVSIRRKEKSSSNYKNKTQIISNNFTNHSTIGNISSYGNRNSEKLLAKEIILFFDEMKQLQISICKKEPNVKDLKKSFEKRKINLYKEALKYSKDNLTNQISQDNRSYSSLFSVNSAFTGTYNGLNYNQNIKELNDSIVTLKTALEDLKSNSQFITSQLRNEISTLNSKIEKQSNSINQYEKNINNNINSVRNIFKSLKSICANLNINYGESVQSQNSNNNSLNKNLSENKFDYYENEIKKFINGLEAKFNNNQNGNSENNNIQIQEQKSSNNDILDTNKLYFSIKNVTNEIIEMIKPYAKEEENENELNNVFDTKYNFEDGIIMNEIENLKKRIKPLITKIDNLYLEKEKIFKELNDEKIQCETYKNALNNAVSNKYNYNNKNIKEEEENFSESENYKRLNNDLLVIQKDLLQKLEMKNIENEKNQETIKELLLINKNEEINNEISSNLVSIEKYRYLLNLYSNEQDQLKQLKSDYLHLIQELSNYIENGTKISIDINKISFQTNKRSTNEINYEEEPDSTELGRINENDLLTDKNSTMSNKNLTNNRMNSKESKGSNCATLNKYININNNNNIPQKIVNIKQITTMKLELKQCKNEVEKLNKKLTDVNDVLSTISSAISKLFQEVQYSNKGKELFTLIFKLLNYTEDKINKMFLEKEKMKK